MRGGGYGIIGLGASFAALSASLVASAQDSSATPTTDRSYSLVYRAAAGCPGAVDVARAIAARAVGSSQTDAAAAAVHLTLELRASGDSSLWVDLAEGSFRRDFHADSCGEAVESMAVIAAMVLDTAPAERRALAVLPSAEFTVEPEPQGGGATADAAAPQLPDALPRPLPADVRAAGDRQASKPRSVPVRSWSWAVAAGGAFESAVAPTPPPGVTAALETWQVLGEWWAPAVRVSLLSTASASTQVKDGDAQFRLLAGRLALCPLRRGVGARLQVVSCADLELGSLRAQGGGAAVNERSASMLWLAPGASLRARLALTDRWGLEVAAGAKRLLRRDHFIFKPSSHIYYLPATSFDLGAGVVWQFL